MSFSTPIQWYHSHADPIRPDGTFNSQLIRVTIYNDDNSISSPPPAISFMVSRSFWRCAQHHRPHLVNGFVVTARKKGGGEGILKPTRKRVSKRHIR
jgi:hypothetical protein